ncbi:MAG: helix-turn-helix transcriptional regulator [Actinomycetota bacterium]|nr:helix-turn-helix transcriptional regulator [Actinomycetota bacterium]
MSIGSEGRAPSAPDRFLVLSLRLRDRRRSLGLTQQEVVRRLADVGVTTTNKALSSLEHGAGIDAAKLPQFAAALDCTVTYLLGLTDDPANWQPESSRGPRAIPADDRSAVVAADPAAPDIRTAPHKRVAAARSAADDHRTAGTSWILGPYLPDEVPAGRTDNPPPD